MFTELFSGLPGFVTGTLLFRVGWVQWLHGEGGNTPGLALERVLSAAGATRAPRVSCSGTGRGFPRRGPPAGPGPGPGPCPSPAEAGTLPSSGTGGCRTGAVLGGRTGTQRSRAEEGDEGSQRGSALAQRRSGAVELTAPARRRRGRSRARPPPLGGNRPGPDCSGSAARRLPRPPAGANHCGSLRR